MVSTQLLLRKIEKLSEQSEKEHEYFLIHQVRYAFILDKIVSITRGKQLKILDIGCFPYHIGSILEQLGHQVYGIASEHEPVKNTNIKIINIETDLFPFKDNFFDLALCNEVIEHLFHSPVYPLKEIYRVTKKGGSLMITTPNIARSINRAKLLFGKSVMYPTEVFFENNGRGNNVYHRHNREYILPELETLTAKTLWRVKESGYFVSYTPFRKRLKPDPWWLFAGKLINYFIMQAVPAVQDTLYIIAEK